jgi:hypothetical protein
VPRPYAFKEMKLAKNLKRVERFVKGALPPGLAGCFTLPEKASTRRTSSFILRLRGLRSTIISVNKTIYVRDEDVPIWERAKELAGDKLSPIIANALKRYVTEREARQKGFERLEYEFSDADSNGLPRKKAFYGRWIFPPNEPEHAIDEDTDILYRGVVATTAKGAVVACTWTEQPGCQSYKRFRVYPSFEEGAKDPESGWVVKSALQKVGVPVEELDI